MTEPLRHAVLGHCIRFAIKSKYFQFAEEKDPAALRED